MNYSIRISPKLLLGLLILCVFHDETFSFIIKNDCIKKNKGFSNTFACRQSELLRLRLSSESNNNEDLTKSIRSKALEQPALSILESSLEQKKDNNLNNEGEGGGEMKAAATGTINERLQAELEEATANQENRVSALGKKYGFSAFKSTKTDEEREAAIAEARNLNGVNPAVAIGGSFFALGAAFGLWIATSALGEYFALHPVESELYFVERVTAVFRNVVMGLVSLASGFFGVTGLGILLLGIRVAYGVFTGELDPTPIKKSQKVNDVKMGNVWDLMLNKKPGRRGGGGTNMFDP